MAGKFIDEDTKVDNKVEMNLLINRMWLKMDREKDTIDEETYTLIDDLVKLRCRKWEEPERATSDEETGSGAVSVHFLIKFNTVQLSC